MAQTSALDEFRISKKKVLLTGGIALFLAGGAVSLIAKAANYHKVLNSLEAANHWWFAICLLGELMAYQGYTFAYRDISRAGRGPKLSWWAATRIIGVGLGAFILGSTAAGLAVDFWALRKAGAHTHESARRVLALNTMEWVALSVMSMLAAVAVLAGAGNGAPLAMTIAWLAVFPACLLGARWFTSAKRVRKFTRQVKQSPPPLHWSRDTWLPWAWANFKKGFADAIGSVVLVRHVLGRPLEYKAGNAGFFIFWMGDLLCLYAALRAFGYALDPASLVLAYATTYLITILPLPAGGAGGVEATLTYTLHLVGVPLAMALTAALIFRVFTFWLPIGPALAFVPTLKGLSEDLKLVQRDTQTPRVKRAPI